MGRPKGSKNKGYFYRAGRGWFATSGTKKVPLRDESGNPLRDENLSDAVVKVAHARFLLGQASTASDSITVGEACQAYLAWCQANSSASTYANRAGILFDFCTGLPAKYWGKTVDKAKAEPDRIHKGNGMRPIDDLKPFHVTAWLNAHPSWKGGKRTKIQAIKRALNYCTEQGLIPANPIKGYKTPSVKARVTYLTPEQEEACYRYAKPAVQTALRVCIRTGARPGCEFAKLTAKHVTFTDRGMEWTFSPSESKTGRERIIVVTDPAIVAIVREQIERHAKGPIFRNTQGKPWRRQSLSQVFAALKKRLAKKGVELDDDACIYSCRHTYAKRALTGFWTNKPCTLEFLAELMGNTPKVCWDHYAKWCKSHRDPLYDHA